MTHFKESTIDYNGLTLEVGGIAVNDGATEFRPGAKVLTAASTLLSSDSGTTFFLATAGGFVTTLPVPGLGKRYKFVVSVAPTGSYTIVTNASANVIKGHVLTTDVNSATDADFEVTGGDTISFVLSKAVAGDWVELECDGTSWFMRGSCSVFDAITITTAS